MYQSTQRNHEKKTRKLIVGVNDLATTNPEIAAQADGWDPEAVTAGSGQFRQFRCPKGHLPKPVRVYKKVAGGVKSCLICLGREVLIGHNDLATTHPEVAARAHGWDPKGITSGSGLIKQFCCKIGHLPKPQAVHIKVRLGSESCAICSGLEVLAGFNDLATTHPEIAAQAYGWDPRTVVAGSDLVRQFRCKMGHLQKPQQVKVKAMCGPDCCSICSGKEVLAGYNDMETTHPNLAKQLVGIDPRTVIAGTNKVLNWRCECGYKWKASGGSRTAGRGCKNCAESGFKLEKPSFFYLVKKPDRFKLGIGNHGAGRLDKHRCAGWELVESIDMSGCAAWELEKRLKATFIANGIPLGQFRETFDGYTESWYKHDLEVRTIRQLCRKLRVNLAEFLAM
jgi:hypothetical protein